jgi:hypothetical protein
MVERSSHHARGQSAQAESPRRIEEWLQLRLIFLDDTVCPVLLPGHQDLAGEAGQAVIVVALVEPAIVPPAVQRNELGQDV